MIRHRWEHHEVSGWGGFDCSCSRASFQENHQYHAHRRRALFLEAKVAVGITPAAKKVIYQPDAPARDPVRFPRWRVGLICSSMRNFLAGVIKTKPPKPAKPPKPSTTGRAVCNARFLLREVHVSGALSGACTGKGPQIANPRPTPKPGNLGPPWPPGTGGDPAGYSRGRPLGGSRLSLVRSGSPGADAARL